MPAFRFWMALLLLLLPLKGQSAERLPQQLVPAELENLRAKQERVEGAFPGLLLLPQEEQTATDAKYSQPYRLACHVYVAERTTGSGATRTVTSYARRFLVHAPDAESLALTKRVARLLLLLYNLNHERLHHDHDHSLPVVEVWLTRQAGQGLSADVGGEQFKNQIYLYNLYADRSPIEWTREVAHEYGHYALPGVSGFTAPEEWANGVLGERLFLKWLREELSSEHLPSETLPFVTAEPLDIYLNRQVAPLVRRTAQEGVDSHLLTQRDASGMDTYTGLALYLDTVYGSKALFNALASTSPQKEGAFVQAPDFLQGVLTSLREETEFTLTSPFPSSETSTPFFLYLPQGHFTVSASASVRSWQLISSRKGVTQTKSSLSLPQSGWYKLLLTPPEGNKATPHLTLRKAQGNG